jgi:hypothetical protein
MRRPATLFFPGACLAVGLVVLGACSSYTARRHVAFTVETVPPGGAVFLAGRVHRGDGCEVITHDHRVRFQRTPESAPFSAYWAPLGGGAGGGTVGLLLTIVAPPLGLATLVASGGAAGLPALIDHQISKYRWKRQAAPVPVTLTLTHPEHPTRTLRVRLPGHPTRQAAVRHLQALRVTFEDDASFTLVKALRAAGVRRLAIVPSVAPFPGFAQGLIGFRRGWFTVLEDDAGVDARVFVLTAGELFARRIRVVRDVDGRVLFDAVIREPEYFAATKSQYFRGDSGAP